MSKKKLIPIILIASLLSYLGYKQISAKQNNTNIYYGTVEAETINVPSELQGKISEIKVEEGQIVKSGDILVFLNDAESRIKLDMSELSKENAENELKKIEDGNRIEEINIQKSIVAQSKSQVNQGEILLNQAQNNLENARINLDYKKKIYEDNKTLYENGSISKYEFDTLKNQYDSALINYKNAAEQIEYAKSQLNSFKAQLNASNEKLNLLLKGATDKTKLTAKLNLSQAEKQEELSKINFDKNIITSPAYGIVETVNFNKGEFVNIGSPVATILDINNMYVKIYVPEKILSSIKTGQEVSLSSDFIKDKKIKGKIIYISPEAEFTPMNIVTKEDRTKLVFEVKIKILDGLDILKPGMLIDVSLN